MHSFSSFITEPKAHSQMNRKVINLPVLPIDGDLESAKNDLLQDRIERTLVKIQTIHNAINSNRQRDKQLAKSFGQTFKQGKNLFLQQAGHKPLKQYG